MGTQAIPITTHHYPSPPITVHHYTSLHITIHHYTSLHITTHHYISLHMTTAHHYPSLHITSLPMQGKFLVMYRSNRSFNIPPRATPRAFDFFENYCSNSGVGAPTPGTFHRHKNRELKNHDEVHDDDVC